MMLLAVIAVVGLSMLAMAVGVLLAGRRLRSSCGGSTDCACQPGQRPPNCPRRLG